MNDPSPVNEVSMQVCNLFLLLSALFLLTCLEKMAFQSHQQNIFYETSANEIGKESPEDFEMSMKFLYVFTLFHIVFKFNYIGINQNLEFLLSSFLLVPQFVLSFAASIYLFLILDNWIL